MLNEVKELIECFLIGKTDALDFSYSLENMIVDNYEKLVAEDSGMAKQLDDTFPEICSEYERGMDVGPFKRKIQDAFTELFKIEELDTVVILNTGKVGTVVDVTKDVYTVEWCDDLLPSGADGKWKVYECKLEDIRLLHKKAMREGEPSILKS